MKFKKMHLCELPYCYSASYTIRDGKKILLLASEANGCCYGFDENSLSRSTVWEQPGGTVSIVPIPGKNGDFLAVQNFIPTFKAENATVVWAEPVPHGWEIHQLLKLPFIHRFDILQRGGVSYFIGSTLCGGKKDTDDWSIPGKVYAAAVPDNMHEPMQLKTILDGLHKNHGYSRVARDNYDCALISCEQGVYLVTPPEPADKKWKFDCIFEKAVSEASLYDLDGDGEEELVTIEPFHGDSFKIYKRINGVFKEVYCYPGKMDFGHVIWTGKLRGIPTVIGGFRRMSQELFTLQYRNGDYKITTIDSGIGPSNIAVLCGESHDTIISANREIGEGALYYVTDGE